MNAKTTLIFKIYQSIVLTAIAIFLGLIFFKTPAPFTRENLRLNKVQRDQVPLVKIVGSVDVSGTVDIGNTVAVEIEQKF